MVHTTGKIMNESGRRQIDTKEKFETRFQWMLDPPHFIDNNYIEIFYNAVLRPEVESTESWEIEITEDTAKELSGDIGISLDPGQVAGFLTPMLGSFKVGGSLAKSQKSRDKKTHTIELEPVETPQQQLVQLVTEYISEYPERLFFINDVGVDKEWRKTKTITQTPRELVFWDLPSKEDAESYDIPETMLLPMAVEFSSGRIEVLHDKLRIPKRENSSWKEYVEHFDYKECIKAVEEATKRESGDIQWIDFRVPLSEDKMARLHFEPRGEYHAGKFAHNFIRMGLKHGIRIIGTVQTEPDIHVLAAYRK